MRYATLFSIQAHHEYYRDGISPEVQLQPDVETMQLIKGHRMRIVERPGMIRITSPLNEEDGSLLIPLSDTDVFRFFLNVNGSLFSSVTSLASGISYPDIFARRAFLHFRNTGFGPGETELEEAFIEPLRTDYFQVQIPSAEEAFFLKNIPITGLANTDFTISGVPGISNPQEYQEDRKRILVNTSGMEAGTRFGATYRSSPDWPSRAYGLVEISNGPSLADEPVFHIRFSAVETPWRFYIIYEENPGDSVGITLEDTSMPVAARFSFSSTAIPTAGITDEIDQKVQDQFTENEILRFESNGNILYREEPYPNLRLALMRTQPLTDLTMNNLPNPSPYDRGVKIINLLT